MVTCGDEGATSVGAAGWVIGEKLFVDQTAVLTPSAARSDDSADVFIDDGDDDAPSLSPDWATGSAGRPDGECDGGGATETLNVSTDQ